MQNLTLYDIRFAFFGQSCARLAKSAFKTLKKSLFKTVEKKNFQKNVIGKIYRTKTVAHS
jgi:hypothetical protein